MKSFRHALSFVAVALVTLSLSHAVQTSALSTWVGAPSPAPSGNIPTPINSGYNTQTKLGALFLNTGNQGSSDFFDIGLSVFGKAIFNGNVQIATGSPAVGKVLTALDSNGTVGWGVAAVGTTSGQSCSNSFSPLITYGNPGTFSWSVPIGVTYVRIKVIGGGGGSSMGTQEYGGSNSGASGGFAQKEMSVVPGSTYAVVVGAGGGKPLSWADDGVSQNGRTGGTSNFGAILSATGGVGGKSRTTEISPGGVGTGGTLNMNGGNGRNSSGVNGPDGGGVPYWGMSPAVGGIEGGLHAGTCVQNSVQCAKSGSTVAAGAGASGGSRGNDGAAGASGAVIIETSSGENCSGTTVSASGVSRIIAGTGVTISPTAGTGDVTVSTVSVAITCPSGMSRVVSLTGNQYCIDTAERTPPASAQVASVCAQEGKYLCTASDLVRACQVNGTPVMSGLADNREVSGDYSPDLDQAILVGNSCTTVAPDNYSAGGGYRCCLR